MSSTKKYFVALHIGAGYHDPWNELKYKALCRNACNIAIKLLSEGCDASKTVVEVCSYLEDDALTNAGFGSNLMMDGTVECEAAIMDSKENSFGAVACCSCVKNPVKLAECIRADQSSSSKCGLVNPLVISGEKSIKEIARKNNVQLCENSLLISDKSRKKYIKYLSIVNSSHFEGNESSIETATRKRKLPNSGNNHEDVELHKKSSLDTIGVICVDNKGNIATASSSGGIALKKPGRIGHVAHFGCGCWAFDYSENQTKIGCCTSGCGELLIKTTLAKRISEKYLSHKDSFLTLDDLIDCEFLNSPYTNGNNSKLCGVLLLSNDKNLVENNIQLHVAHTTESFAIGYCSSGMKKPKACISRLDKSLVGAKCTSQCFNVTL